MEWVSASLTGPQVKAEDHTQSCTFTVMGLKLPCTSESPMGICEAGHSKPVLWDNPEGWSGEGGGRGVQGGGTHVYPWLIHVDVRQNPPQLLIKELSSN